jgi:hypothetical protein
MARLQSRTTSANIQSAAFHSKVSADMAEAAETWLEVLRSAPPRSFCTRPTALTSRGMCIGREREAAGWAKISNATQGDDEKPLSRWTCVQASEDTWAWWGSTAGEAWTVCDASRQVGIGYFGPIRAVHRPCLPEERASFTLGTDATDKNSSSL